jgi:hypothetical protein
MFNVGPSDYYTDAFRQVLEDLMYYMRNTQGLTSTYSVTPQNAWANDQDLYGYLQNVVGLAPQYHWVTMRLNNLTDPTQFGSHIKKLLVPNLTWLEQQRSAYETSSTISN